MLQDLVWASVTTLDERIFATMLDLIADQTQRRDVRLAALRVASHYADPPFLPKFDDRLREGLPVTAAGRTKYLDFFKGSLPPHISGTAGQVRGARPVVGDPRERLLSALTMVMERPSEDEHLVGAARALLVMHFKVPTRR
jgi:hypothetical protein